MDTNHLNMAYLVCHPDDADAFTRGEELKRIRILGPAGVSDPIQWIEGGMKFDLVCTQSEDRIVNGMLSTRLVDRLLHRVDGYDHDKARQQTQAD